MELGEERRAQTLLQQLARMGIASELGPGGTTVVGTLELGPEPFPTLGEAVQIRSLRFTTTNSQRIKCLEPPALFQLPMLSIAGCDHAGAIEARVRTAWKERIAALRRTHAWLAQLGIDAHTDGHGAHLAFALGGEDREARARLVQPDRIVLPSRGPLSGRKVQPAGARLLTIDSPFESSAELEIAVTNRLQRLERNLDRAEVRRRAATAQQSAEEDQYARTQRRLTRVERPAAARAAVTGPFRILLVGASLGGDEALQAMLRRAGHETVTVRSGHEAQQAFATRSYDLVLTDTRLGREEGLELVPLLQEIPGVSRLPIVLVDDHLREERRETAKRIGAAGYLARPLDAKRMAAGIVRLVGGARRRRYDRFDERLAVSWASQCTGFTTGIGRLGMFVRTEEPRLVAPGENLLYEVSLPNVGAPIGIHASTVYAVEPAAGQDGGMGLRFETFEADDESALIAFVRALHARSGPAVARDA